MRPSNLHSDIASDWQNMSFRVFVCRFSAFKIASLFFLSPFLTPFSLSRSLVASPLASLCMCVFFSDFQRIESGFKILLKLAAEKKCFFLCWQRFSENLPLSNCVFLGKHAVCWKHSLFYYQLGNECRKESIFMMSLNAKRVWKWKMPCKQCSFNFLMPPFLSDRDICFEMLYVHL